MDEDLSIIPYDRRVTCHAEIELASRRVSSWRLHLKSEAGFPACSNGLSGIAQPGQDRAITERDAGLAGIDAGCPGIIGIGQCRRHSSRVRQDDTRRQRLGEAAL